MPLPNRLTNPGRPLRNHFFGGESDTVREIPPEFRAACDLTVIEIPLPWDQEIIPLSDTVLASKAEQKVTSEWNRRTTYKQFGPVQLLEFATNKDKQLVTRQRNLKFISDPIASPGPSTDVSTKNLGNLHFIEEVEDAQFVFSNLTSTTERPDVLPEKWKALLPLHERKESFTGTVTDPPVLGTDEFARTEAQDDVFNMSRTTRTRAPVAGYPVDMFEEKLTPEQQVETVDETLDNLLQHLVPTPTMVEGEVQNLGDGRSVRRVGIVPSVFPKLMTSQERVDRTPEVFRAALPLDEKRITFTGTVTDPQVLGTDELFRSESQDTVFNMTRTTRKRVPLTGYPVHVLESKLTPEKQISTIDNVLDLGLQDITPSATMVEGSVTNLGDGRSVMTTGTVPTVFEHKTSSVEILDVVPEVFKATLPIYELRTTFTGSVTDPQVLGTGELSRSETQDDVFNLTRIIRKRSPSVYPATAVEYRLTPDQQVETIDNTLDLGIQTLVPTALMIEGDVRDLGNGTSVLRTGTVPSIFDKKTTSQERTDVTPEVFRASIPLDERKVTFTGTVLDPQVLGTDELYRSETQDTVFNMTRTTRKRTPVTGYPVHVFESRLTPEQLVETLDNCLDVGLQTIVPTATMLDGTVTNLGDGRSVRKTGSIPSVFPRLMTAQERTDVTPEVFRASIPLDERRSTFPGTVLDPQVLGTDELYRSETQETAFNITRTTRKRTPVSGYPAHVFESKLTPEGQIETVDNRLDIGVQTLVPTALMLEGNVKNLGDGRSVMTTGSVPAVFGRKLTAQERSDVTPEVFRATIPLDEKRETFPGTVLDPQVLGTDELYRSEQQDTVFNLTRTTRKRTPVGGYPVHVFESKLTPEQLIETIDNVLDVGVQTITPSAVMLEGSVQNLGDGRSVKRTGTIPVVFEHKTATKERLDVTPEVFRATIPTDEKRTTFPGTVVDPQILGTDELYRSETQDTAFNVTRTTRKRTPVSGYPVHVLESRLSPEKQIETLDSSLDVGLQVLVPTATMLDGSVTDLGDGRSVMKVGTVPSVFTHKTSSIEVLDVVPEVFKATLPLYEVKQTLTGTVTDPQILGTGELSRSETQDDVFNLTRTTRKRGTGTYPAYAYEYKLTPDKQVETVTNKLDLGLQTLVPSALMIDGEVRDLGNGTSVLRTGLVPSLFDHKTTSIEIPDVVPEVFRATLPVYEKQIRLTGTVADPQVLGTGELSRKETQDDIFNLTRTVRTRSPGTYPVTANEYKLTRDKQVETIVNKLDLGLQTITPTALMLEAEVRDLGNGTSVLRTGTVISLFGAPVYSKTIENLIPPRFRASIPTTTSEITSTGLVNPDPILGTGELSHEEQQIDVFNKRTKSVSFGAITPPVTFTDEETSEEYGGGILDVIFTLNTIGSLTIDQGLRVVSSEITALGNGYEIRVTKQLQTTEWSELEGTEVDPRTGIVIDVKKKVVPAGTTGGVGTDGYVDVKTLDKWRSIRIASKLDSSTLPPVRQWETTVEHRFPNELLGLSWVWAAASAPNAYDFDMALVLDMREGYAGPCRARVTESFTEGPPTDVIVPTVFCPQAHMIGFSWAFAAAPSGHDVGITRAQARTWSIPPSLHPTMDIGGGAVALTGGSFTSSLASTSPAVLPAPGSLIVKAVEVEPWRFGIFFRRLTELYVPDCGGGGGAAGASVMVADGSSADAYVVKDWGFDETDIWITFDMAFSAAAMTVWDTSGSGNLVVALSSGDQNIASVYEIGLHELGGGPSWYLHGGDSSNQTVGPPPPTAGVWQHCEMHIHVTSNTTVHFYVNGNFTNAFTDPEVYGVRKLLLGILYAGNHTADTKAYFSNVKVSTTRGDDFIFGDPLDTDLSAWTSVIGACSIVTSPF